MVVKSELSPASLRLDRYLQPKLGSARVPRADFGVSPKQASLGVMDKSGRNLKVRGGETPSPARETRALPG